jgi:hypothetical protein
MFAPKHSKLKLNFQELYLCNFSVTFYGLKTLQTGVKDGVICFNYEVIGRITILYELGIKQLLT